MILDPDHIIVIFQGHAGRAWHEPTGSLWTTAATQTGEAAPLLAAQAAHSRQVTLEIVRRNDSNRRETFSVRKT